MGHQKSLGGRRIWLLSKKNTIVVNNHHAIQEGGGTAGSRDNRYECKM